MSAETLSPPRWQPIHDAFGLTAPAFEDRPLGSYIEQHARERPDTIALHFMGRAISYKELNEEANKLANVLVDWGIGKDDVVGFHMPNIPQYCIGLVAVAKIGCSGSGVAPLLAPGELEYQIDDAGISVLMTAEPLLPAVEAMQQIPACLKHLLVSRPQDFLGGEAAAASPMAGLQTHAYLATVDEASSQFQQNPVQPHDRFMIQYTGGTTGKPKGAQLSVRNILHNADQTFAYLPFDTEGEIMASAFPLFHAAGMFVHLLCMKYGATALLIPDPRDVAYFCQQMTRFPPTRIGAVPTLFMMIVNAPESADIDFSRLKNAMTGAAPLPADDRSKIEAMIGEGKLCDVFGMTETGPVHVHNPPGHTRTGSVGIPVPGADTRIVDTETGTREMPVGEAGEIITSGPQVMLGYLNLPGESEKAVREWQGKTWMYTGDVGYMDEDGYIFLCDRAKDMLIVGGFKVFSVELEDKLKALDCIAESAVIGEPDKDRPGNDVVNLFVELSEDAKQQGHEQLRDQITAFCRANMSPYKVPKKIHFIEQIPLTAVGKIDKKVLRKQLNE